MKNKFIGFAVFVAFFFLGAIMSTWFTFWTTVACWLSMIAGAAGYYFWNKDNVTIVEVEKPVEVIVEKIVEVPTPKKVKKPKKVEK